MKRIAVLTVLFLAAGCGGGDTTPPPPSTSATHPASSTTSQAATAGPHTLAELAEDPCAAITEDDRLDAGVVTEGTPMPAEPGTCSWVAPPGVVIFKAFPTTDETPGMAAKPGAQPVTVAGKAGVRVMVEESCFTIVTVAAGQSFRVGASGVADACGSSQAFAEAVVANLK